jgi:hypothetical protein
MANKVRIRAKKARQPPTNFNCLACQACTNTQYSALECFVRTHKAEIHYPYQKDIAAANEHFRKLIPATDDVDNSLYPVFVFYNMGVPVAWNDAEECCGYVA